MDPKVTAAGAIGAGAGALQTPLIREFVDRKYPTTNIPALKGFGYPSALIGMIGGGAGLAVGAVGLSKGKDGRQRLADIYVEPAIDYGITALVTGILSGVWPAVTQADCVAKGGYWYDGACHKTPSTGLTSMQDAPQVQTAAYKPPLSPSYNIVSPAVDMNVLKQMSAEVQRLSQSVQQLSQENAQLKSMAPAITVQPLEPGTVSSKQARYGFMQGIVPGQPTERAKEFGFMDDGRTPIAKVQQMKKRYDFMG